MTLTIYRANEAPLTRTVEIGAFSRGTIVLSAYLQGARSLGVRVQADRTIGAAMVVRRGINSPFATVGNSVLAKRWYLAEGYTGLTFHERIYVLNPQSSDAGVQLRLLPARGGKSRIATYVVPARRTYSIDVNALAPHSSVAAVVTGTVPILVERVLTFGDGGDGAAGETGSTQAATNWLFADGNTAKEAETYVTILNPGQRPAIVTALIFDTRGHLLGGRSVTVEGLQRGTIRLNDLAHASGIAINVTSSQPVVVERSMYDGNPNKGQRRGSVVLGRNGTGRSWLFPDGDTSIGSREYLFALNPNGATLKLHASIYLSNGRELGKDFTVSGGARLTIDVGRMIPGALGSLHATRLTSLNNVGFVAEQAISNPDIDSGYETAGTAG